MLDFPGLLPKPPLHVAGRSAKVALQFHFGQAPEARAPQAVAPDQFALRAFDGVAMFHALLESVGWLFLAPRLQMGVMFTRGQRPMSLVLAQTLTAQQTIVALGTEFKARAPVEEVRSTFGSPPRAGRKGLFPPLARLLSPWKGEWAG